MENTTAITHSSAFAVTTENPDLFTLLLDVRVGFRIVCGVLLLEIVSLCGLVTNVIVMAVFQRQGIMTESSTVSLFILALSDFLVQLVHIALGIAEGLTFAEENGFIGLQSIDPRLIKFLAFFDAKIVLGHTLCWLTAYLSFERCFSVLFPFKVKLIFSPKNSLIAMICIYAGSIFTFFPLFARIGVTEKIVNNMTITTWFYWDPFGYDLVLTSVLLNPLILRNVAIIIVVLSNLLILIKVKSSKDWRKSNASSNTSESSGEKTKTKSSFQKEKKLIKMISMISVIFLCCTVPDMIAVAMTETGVCVRGDPVWVASYAFCFFVESINSCVNIFVYYFMSSSFNKGFKQLFGMSKQDNK